MTQSLEWRAVVATRDELGESPFWHPHERMLYWVDIPGRRIRRADPQTGADESWDVPQDPGCIAPVEGGGLMVAMRDGIYRAASWGGTLELVVEAAHDPATTRFNDGKADPLGRFWASSIYEPRDQRLARLYCLDLRGGRAPVLQAMADDATTGNGLAWSPDAKTLYFSDTPQHVIRAWDWDAQANSLSRPRVFRQFDGKPAGWKAGDTGYGGRPDGAAVDAQGNYWSAMFEGSRLLQLSPAGEVLAEHALPVRCPTMPCFGGEDLRTLFITSGGSVRPPPEVQALPFSGRILAARVDGPGLPVNFVRT
jgi:sugar lactone lactonase YvrE